MATPYQGPPPGPPMGPPPMGPPPMGPPPGGPYMGMPMGPPRPAMNLQGAGWRFLSLLIDTIILIIIYVVLTTAFGSWETTTVSSGDSWNYNANYGLQGGWAAVWWLLVFLYWTLTEGLMGATVGKLALGQRVVKEDGSKITWGAAVVRNIFKWLDCLLFPGYIVGWIMIAASSKKQRLGDKLAKTVVVKKGGQAVAQPMGGYGMPGGTMPQGPSPWAQSAPPPGAAPYGPPPGAAPYGPPVAPPPAPGMAPPPAPGMAPPPAPGMAPPPAPGMAPPPAPGMAPPPAPGMAPPPAPGFAPPPPPPAAPPAAGAAGPTPPAPPPPPPQV